MNLRDAPSSYEREFISASRLLMICGLVYHHLFEIPGSSHSPRTNMAGTGNFVPEFINALFHMGLMAAVPVLSVISGYLFFCRPRLDYKTLFLSRLHSVALPSWLWSALWLAGAITLNAALGGDGRFGWSSYDLADLRPMALVNGVFGVTREPFAFQFWFVHDLLLTLLLAPLIHLLLVRLQWRLLVIAAAGWLLMPDPPLFFAANVPVFFTVGAYLTLDSSPALKQILEQLRTYRWPLLHLFIAALIFRVMSQAFAEAGDFLQGYVYLCILRLAGVLAISALIYNMVIAWPVLTAAINRYSGYSFFIFALHYPLIEIVQSLVLRIPGHASSTGLFLSWLLIPFCVIALCIATAQWCERHTPSLLNLLNGGRTMHASSPSVCQPRPGVS